MHTSTMALAGLAATAAAETIHGALVFSRHGDRTTKHFGSQVLTPLGAQQVFQVGSDYRARYLSSSSPHHIQGISESEYVPAQIYASAPDQPILLNTATSFLQALYPPLGDTVSAQDLANGSSVSSPLTGYQYVTLHGVNDDSPESVWIKGDDDCPVVAAASADFKKSSEFQSRLASTRDFYQSLYPLVHEVYPSASDLSYAKAYDIFDVINVEKIHNASSPAQAVTPTQLHQLRTLADSAEFGRNYNASQPSRSLHAGTLAGAVLSHLNQTAATNTPPASAAPKLTVLAGSYDTFLAFFGRARLTDASDQFFGLPDYASTMAFELFTPGETNDESMDRSALRVRFLFRNGTAGALRQFPLFGTGKVELPWAEFEREMQQIGVGSAEEWCGLCRSEAVFCAAYRDADRYDILGGGRGSVVSKGSWIAVVVVMGVAIAGNLVWAAMWLVRNRRAKRERMAGVASTAAVGGDSESARSYDKESV
ncbi:histidine phosphatase superfamily [Chaetomium fimeti]|uniref:Histidine phosphatase superfamily n=1 Tax=Chaetomium fimeti TaxID=1854472 RepID=A0AAE0H655_9PEZI|nr:histidine phosphatase superfamily [Chaetomium fimeti]